MVKLKVKNVEFNYASVPVLKDVYIELSESEMLGVVGPNGAGKSTLIRCIDRILKPQRGSIVLDERDIKEMHGMELAKKIGYIPQSATQVFPATVFDTVLMGRRPHIGWKSSEKDTEKVLETLQMLNIESFAMRDINELSGGQRQNVFIARALTQEPEASRYADRIIMMNSGEIFSAGDPVSTLTPENIEHVYGVEVRVHNQDGSPYIVPIRPVKQNGKGRCENKRNMQ
jgi:iron complex transport system ATP-binding protein